MSTSNGHLPQWGPAKLEGDVPGSVSFTGTLHSGVRGKPTQLSQGCAGPGKPEGDVPGSVSFTGTLPSGVGATPGAGATQGAGAPGRGLSLPGRIQDIKKPEGGCLPVNNIFKDFAGYAIPAQGVRGSE